MAVLRRQQSVRESLEQNLQKLRGYATAARSPVAGGMAAYDLALPVEQVDMVFLTQPEDNSTRVRFDTIYNFIVTVTSGDQIDQFLIICARNGYGSVE